MAAAKRYEGVGPEQGPALPPLNVDSLLDAVPEELDPVLEDAAIAAFPELEGQPERIQALVDFVRQVGGG